MGKNYKFNLPEIPSGVKKASAIGLPAICGWLLYNRLSEIQWTAPASGMGKIVFVLLICLALGFLVWVIDSLLWKLFLPPNMTIPFAELVKRNIIASSTGFFTPVQLGEYYGKRKLIKGLSSGESLASTFFYRMAKVSAKVVLGLGALSAILARMPELTLWSRLAASLTVIVGLMVLFQDPIGLTKIFQKLGNKLPGEIPFPKRLVRFRLQAIGWASVKILLNVLQFVLLFKLWDPHATHLIPGLIFFYTLASFVPSTGFLDPIVKGALSLYIVSPGNQADIPVLIATTIVWTINLGLPAFFGSWLFNKTIKKIHAA
jgi:hypothetical protein